MKEEDINEQNLNSENDSEQESSNEETNTQKEEPRNEAENAEQEDPAAEHAENLEEKDPLDVALEEIAALKDKNLRLMAEFENYKRRSLKERAELILNGGVKAVTAILPVVDDMERAIASQQKTEDIEAIREGIVLIHQKLMKTMESLGVKPISTEGADFDTDLHEAVALVPGMGDEKKGKVIDCMQTGYTMNDKVIRHAKVAVGQ
jgi:molecular chaperone GrpE